MHSPHPDVHDVGLADDCEDCEKIAANPFAGADDRLLRALVEQAVDRNRLSLARSGNEAVATATILTTLEHVGKLGEFSGDLVSAYLADRWRLDAWISNPRSAELEGLRTRLQGAIEDATRCPECDFGDVLYVRATHVRATAWLGENTEASLHMTDVLVCSRCHWWRPATAHDQPVLAAT